MAGTFGFDLAGCMCKRLSEKGSIDPATVVRATDFVDDFADAVGFELPVAVDGGASADSVGAAPPLPPLPLPLPPARES